jgi:hypothetical protein
MAEGVMRRRRWWGVWARDACSSVRRAQHMCAVSCAVYSVWCGLGEVMLPPRWGTSEGATGIQELFDPGDCESSRQLSHWSAESQRPATV